MNNAITTHIVITILLRSFTVLNIFKPTLGRSKKTLLFNTSIDLSNHQS